MSSNSETLVQQFNNFFQIYQSLLPYLSLSEAQKDYFESRKNWLKRLKEVKFPVAFFGSFSSGKSTLINAILHQELLPEAVQSTTAFPTLISKGDRDIAIIYYLDEKIKNKYRAELTREIRKIVGNKLPQPNELPSFKEDPQKYLQVFENAIVQYEEESGNPLERSNYEQLKQLIENWYEEHSQSIEVNLTNLKSYVEGHPDALSIDRIEVSVKNINLADDIIIVDLPGVAVNNSRHLEFTKKYLTKKAKAFIVCMKPRSLIDGEEAKFLKDINKINSKILSNSFWIINQWDSLNDLEKRQEEKNFQDKIHNHKFKIDQNRFFKISALQYSLLKHIAEGTLDKTTKRKQEIDTLKSIKSSPTEISSIEAQSLLKTVEAIVDVAKFKEALFAYLNTDAKNEFFASATNELSEMIQKLTQIIYPDYSQYQDQTIEEFINEKYLTETIEELDKFVVELEQKIKDFATDIRLSGKTDYWTDSIQNEINREIDRILINSPELENKLRTGLDQDIDISILASILKDDIALPNILRQYLSVDSFMTKVTALSKVLKQVNKRYLPEKTLNLLEDKLDGRDIQMRIYGVADIIFFELGDKFQEIGLNLKNLLKEDKQNENELSESALNQYRKELTTFISNLKTDINKYINRSIKNHVEYLAKELPKLLNDNSSKKEIARKIRENLEQSETLEIEIQKKEAISSAYQKLTELQDSL